MRESYVLLDHTADAGAEISSPTKEGLVRASTAALAEILGMGKSNTGNVMTAGLLLRGRGDTAEEQLVDLLNGWLALTMKRRVRPEVHGVSWDSGGIEAAVEIHEPDGSRTFSAEIKAVTYHTAAVIPPRHTGEPWAARWIVDL
ncbi:MAG: archease [bacterium]